MAGMITRPYITVKIKIKTKICFDLKRQLKDITAQQHIRIEGQVKQLNLNRQFAIMMGIAIRTNMLEDFQGSIDAAKAMVKISQKYGKLASFIKYKITKVAEQATISSISNDLKLNLYGTFLRGSSIIFSYDCISTLDSLGLLQTMMMGFSLGGVSYYFLNILADDFFRMILCADYFLRFVFMISSMTWLYCLEDQ